MAYFAKRSWVPLQTEEFIQSLAQGFSTCQPEVLELELQHLIERSRAIHDQECINLNPATNVMNPRGGGAAGVWNRNTPILGISRRQI